MDVWSLANPANFSFLTGTGQGGNSSANFSLTFNCATLGLATNVPATIKIFGTFISSSGYRSGEAIAAGAESRERTLAVDEVLAREAIGAHGRVQRRHQQRGGYALAADVSEGDSDAGLAARRAVRIVGVVEDEEVVVIA